MFHCATPRTDPSLLADILPDRRFNVAASQLVRVAIVFPPLLKWSWLSHRKRKANAHFTEETEARIIHECRCEAFETEARRGFSQVRPTQAYCQSVEEAE